MPKREKYRNFKKFMFRGFRNRRFLWLLMRDKIINLQVFSQSGVKNGISKHDR